MKAGVRAPGSISALRRRAQARLKQKQSLPGLLESEGEVRRLLQELQVHEIELELQNEELQQAGQAAREAAEKFTELYDFAPIGYFSIDREGRITEANLAFAAMLGVQRSRILQKEVVAFVPVAERPAFRVFLGEVFQEGRRTHREMTLRPGKGQPLDVMWDSVVSGSGVSCRVAMVDISAQKRAQRDRMVVSQLESLGVLAGGIAHDFNNLLAVILLGIEAAGLAAGSSVTETRSHLDAALKAVCSAQGLVRKFMSLAEGGTSLHAPVSLPGLIRESVRIGLAGSNLRVEWALAEDTWTIQGDERQIRQVIQGIVLNAKEAMPDAGQILVRAENRKLDSAQEPALSSGRYVCVSIADAGVGISKEALPKIFEPYYSTKSRDTRKGMGLGLTICHAVMRKHKGAITVESEAGKGATFHLFFPVSPEA